MVDKNFIPKQARGGYGIPLATIKAAKGIIDDSAIIENGNFVITKKGYARKDADIRLRAGDEIAQRITTSGNDVLFIITAYGQSLCVHESEFAEASSRGLRAIKIIYSDDYVVACDVVRSDKLFIISENGVGKCVRLADFPVQHRNTEGRFAISTTEATGVVKACKSMTNNDITVWTERDMVLRTDQIPIMRRTAIGCIVIRLEEGDKVAGAC